VCGVRCGVTPYPCRMAFGCPSWLFSKRGLVSGMRVAGVSSAVSGCTHRSGGGLEVCEDSAS